MRRAGENQTGQHGSTSDAQLASAHDPTQIRKIKAID
jgi:hypothetical protein